MKITLDGQMLNYTLEGEQNLYQILTSIAKWLSPQNAEITRLRLNGETIDQWNRRQLENIPIEEIQNLEITTMTEREQEYSDLGTLFQYFQLLQEAIQGKQGEALMEILEEYKYVQPSLEHYLRSIFLTDGSARFPLDRIPSSESEWAEGEQYVQRVLAVLEARLQELIHPYESCKALIPILSNTKQEIEQTSVLLQTGRDQEAIRNVLTFIEILSKALRLLSRLQPVDPQVQELHRTLSPPLKELSDAFLHRDSVLIGDLLEYEIAPKLEELRILLEKSLLDREQ
ncbi:MAG: hypothetical protein Kow009_10730 [Spirochaetales bacterium]